MLVNAQIILIRCRRSKRLYGGRMEQIKGNVWNLDWAFPIKESMAKNEGYDKVKLTVNCCVDDDYPGCPDCKAKGFFMCGKCGKLTCNDGEDESTCAWCGHHIESMETVDEMDLSLGDF